jgi:hypothetical protein
VQLDEASREHEPEARALTLLDADAHLLELLEDPLVVLAGEMRREMACSSHGHKRTRTNFARAAAHPKAERAQS